MAILQIVNKLTTRLEQENIRYCHWKSNEHVDAAVQGDTDLDVLVDLAKKDQLERVLGEVGFKYFEAVGYRKYVDIEDYLAIDEDTGTLVHLHLHYKLELGEKQVKGYHLPWEELLLSSRIYSSEHQIYIAEPNIEIILLIIRATLKVRNRDRLTSLLGRDYFKGDVIRELRWLLERVDLSKVKQLSEELTGVDASKLIMDAIASESNLKKLLYPRNSIQLALQKYRRYHPIVATPQRWSREAQNIFYKILSKYLRVPVITRRTNATSGTIIAILGADGAGKSTVTSDIVKCLSKKLDVFPVYLGSGDGEASIPRLPLILASNVAKKLRPKRSRRDPKSGARADSSPPKQDNAPIGHKKSKISSLRNILWAITLAYEKQNKLKRSRLAKDRGIIVISDRYPQSQFLGFNDGPLLSNGKESGSKFLRTLQEWEFESYQQMAETMSPDVVIKLNVTPEVALTRKPESPPEVVRKKAGAVFDLKFPPGTNVITIDADGPLDDVLLKAKRAVWESL